MKPRRHDDGRGGRRPPPPPGTGQEQRWFDGLRSSGRAVRVQLVGGDELRGRIGTHERDWFELLTDDGPRLVVRKDDVRTVAED